MKSNLYISGDVSMYGNTATSYAPGIYNGNKLYIEGTVNIEDGVYIKDRESVAQVINDILPNSVIQINGNDYVKPDESLAPIVVAVATDSHPVLTNNDLQAFRKPTVGFENWVIKLSDDNTQVVLVPYVIEEYTITYLNLNGATHTNPTTYTSETPTFILTPPSYLKCKYFIGWYDENNILIREIKQGTQGNIILTARWKNIGCCKIGYVLVPKNKGCCKKIKRCKFL